MLHWIAMAVLAAAAAIPLLMALRRPAAATAASAQAMAIYRDQLDEVARDASRGAIGAKEAEAARTEIARRLIREGNAPALAANTSSRLIQIATIAIIAMPIAALALYLELGAPLVPDQPLSSRPDAVALQDVRRLVAQVEAHLSQQPDDGKGWEVLAPVYSRLGRDSDAATAWSRAVTLLGATAEREGNLGEALVTAAGGTVTLDAKAAFEKARDLAPTDPRPQFYLALALSQSGDKAGATAAWRALIDSAPQDASWLDAAQQEYAKVAGPEGMVASLAARLQAAPDDPEGWAQLVRSYMVLGQPDQAQAALGEARTALAGDAAKIATVETAAREAGLETQQ
jgi:cytochrome c-type biogenesis protein CcmH